MSWPPSHQFGFAQNGRNQRFPTQSVQVNTRGWGKSQKLMSISHFPEVEEIHAVAGNTCLVMKVRARDSHALESLLGQLYMMPHVVSTSTLVVLSTYRERPAQAEVTEDWPEIVMPEE